MVGKVLQLSRDLWGGTVLENEPKVICGFKPFEKSHDVGMRQRVEKRDLGEDVMMAAADVMMAAADVMMAAADAHAGRAPRAACAAAPSCLRT